MSTETKHTPGPWKFGIVESVTTGFNHFSIYPVSEESIITPICDVSPAKKVNEIDIYNAKLISAAPDMLKALQNIMKIRDLWGAPNGEVEEQHRGEVEALCAMEEDIKIAIKKATE